MDNPLLDQTGLPRFDEIESAHVQPAIDALVAEAEAALALAGRAQPVAWDSMKWARPFLNTNSLGPRP